MQKRYRRDLVLFWGAILLCLIWGGRQLLAHPDQSSPNNSSSPLIISEFLTSNTTDLVDEDGDHSDWIEITNQSRHDVNLAGWTLTDDPTQPDKWTFREQTLRSGERLVIFASGKNRREIDPEEGRPYLHTNFKLASDGGFLALYGPTSRRYLDASVYEYPVQYSGVSFGRMESAPDATEGRAGVYFANPTPGAANDESLTWLGLLPGVEFSVPHGFYREPVEVQLSTTAEQGVIRYTTDGSTPSETNGFEYQAPLVITTTTLLRAATFRPGYRPSPVMTQSYFFLSDIVAQPTNPPGFPETWGTHSIDFGGYAAGSPRMADYEMDPEIVQDAHDGPLVEKGLLSIPSISLVTDMSNLDIYANPRGRGREYERPVSVELIYGDGSREGFQINAGFRIQGGAGRWEFMPKHPFRLFFRQEYGAARLNYPLFADSPVTEFDTLVLRAGVDQSFAGHPPAPDHPVDHRQATYLNDEWARASQIAASGVGSHGMFVHLYLNGLYWGLYNLVERPDSNFAASYFGGDPDSWFTANHGGAVDEDIDRFTVMMQLAQAGNLADPAAYATMLEFIDAKQFSDYILVNWIAGNTDWPENNWYVNVQNPAGRNRFFVWDAEWTWQNGAQVWLGSDGEEGAPFPNVVKLVFTALMQNADFRLLFADRMYHLLFHGGALSDDASRQRWQDLMEEIESAIVAESARWGDARYDEPIRRSDWLAANERVLAQMEGNAERLLAQARAAGYYPAIDPPLFSQHGGEFSDTLSLTLRAPQEGTQGVIYYTTDGSDPRVAGSGAVSPAAKVYEGPIELTTATTVKARVLDGDTWSALTEASFRRRGQQSDLFISEIMYHPTSGDDYEFLELHNGGDLAIDLTGAYFSGITFRFGDGASLGAGQTLVLVRDLTRFRRIHPEAEVAGVYDGRLSDKGETITLYDAHGKIITSITYDDENGWPLSADGAGDSLELIDPHGNRQSPANWRASRQINGSPGKYEGITR